MDVPVVHRGQTRLLTLCVAALGVVYGDIGTSPLYAMKETFFGAHPLSRTMPNVLGVLSLVFWTITIVVSCKYVLLILRADLRGEGGIFSLLGIIRDQMKIHGNGAANGVPKTNGNGKGSPPPSHGRLAWVITTAVMVGAASLYGEGVITPAISVLSAYEGLEVATSALKPAIVPLTVLTLLVLFWFQRRGSARVGRAFGPIMVVWFLTIGGVGLYWILQYPAVLQAVSPLHAFAFLQHAGWRALFVLGAIVLAITGVEALFADLGHFGRRSIQTSWFSLVFPSLLLNYFGQGARLLHPAPVANGHLFYALFPQHDAMIYAVVALSTMATVIASQALISGAFSLTRQAIALGFFPRLQVIFTSAEVEGQIYMPGVNWLLFTGCALLVLVFKTSSNLAAAYGIAVTGTMTITSFIFYFVARGWGWRWYLIGPLCAGFLAVDLSYFFANTLKFIDGGYVPIVIAGALFALMKTWLWGRGMLAGAYIDFCRFPMRRYIDLKQHLMESPSLRVQYGVRKVAQVERAIVFLASRPIRSPEDPCPIGLRIYLKRNGALPKHVILMNVSPANQPQVSEEQRYTIQSLGANIVAINAQYGFMETPNIPKLLRTLKQRGEVKINENRWTIQIGEEEVILDPALPAMQRAMVRFFQFIIRITSSADRYFGLREFPGRNKTVIPIIISPGKARVVVSDEEPTEAEFSTGAGPARAEA